MRWFARLLGCTEGQLYSFALALALLAWLTPVTITSLRDHNVAAHPKPIPFERLGGRPADPLVVVAAGYASARPGDAPLPPDTIAAGSDGRQDVRRGFLRLGGDADVLRLTPLPDPAYTRSAEVARLRLCPVQTIWLPKADWPLSQEPGYDCAISAAGVRAADGSWTFNLGGFADRATGNGFALVPAASGPAPFQVTFQTGSPVTSN